MIAWRDLGHPDYVLAGLEAFLVGALPVWGLGAIDTESVVGALKLPTWPMLLGGLLAGLLNGVRALRTLAMPAPVRSGGGGG